MLKELAPRASSAPALAPTIPRAPRFPRVKQGFFTELRKEVDAYFQENNLKRTGNAELVIKTVLLLSLYIGGYCMVVFGNMPLWGMLLTVIGMGFVTAAIGMGVAHDACHGSFSSNPTVNKYMQHSFDFIGGNAYIWNIMHNRVHHTFTNVHGHDGDLEVAPFIRLSPHAPLKKVHRFQYLFAWPVYSLATIFWVFVKDFKKMFAQHIGPVQKKHPKREIFRLFLFKALYIGYMIVLPLVVMDIAWYQFLVGFLALHLVAGITLGVIFQLAHVVEETEFPMPDEQNNMEDVWAKHQLITTNNFATKNRFMGWFSGGLNFQVEHHLFPKISSVHYPAINPIVKRVSAEYGIPYNEHPTFGLAVRSHYRTLKAMGRS